MRRLWISTGEYPTFNINIGREQQRLRDHDVIESETYHSALELGAQALRVMGLHPFFAE